jgi:hypothetical protein
VTRELSIVDVVTERDGLPTFELDYRYDDPENPAEVTLYEAAAEERTTTWVTASVEDAISVDSVA